MASTYEPQRVGPGRRSSDQLLRKAEAIAHLGSWLLELVDLENVESNPLYWSDEAYRIFGHAPKAFPATPQAFFAAVHPDDSDAIRAAFRQALRDGTEFRIEHRVVHPNGAVRTVESRATFDRDPEGRPLRAIGTVLDVTERREMEAALREGEARARVFQRLESVGRLAAGVAHDFNNILTVITGHGELALMDLPEGHPAREEVQSVLKAAERATELTRQLLAFGQRQVLQPVVLDLNDVLRELHGLLSRLAGDDVALELRLASAPTPVFADRAQVEQVVVNLVANARDAMSEGGGIILETAHVDIGAGDTAERGAVPVGRWVRLTVSDTGPPIPPDLLPHAFEPFVATRGARGGGMSLATVYGIVQQSGGLITLESAAGSGTTYRIFLPLGDGEVQRPVAPLQARSLRGTETILLVEDEPGVLQSTRSLLERFGYTVIEAARPSDAVRVAGDPLRTIHLLLTDVVMPEMRGPDLARTLREQRPGLKVLCMSGHPQDAASELGGAGAALPYLQKPFTAEGLARRVRDVLDR